MSRPAPRQLPKLRELLDRVHLRLILFAVALAAGSLVAGGLIVIRGDTGRNLDLAAQTLRHAIEPAVIARDRQAIGRGLSLAAVNPAIERVVVVDPAGAVLARWGHRPAADHGWFAEAANAAIWPDPFLARIERQGAVLAEVRIYGNAAGLLSYTFSGLIISLACIALTMLATRILAHRLQRDVIDPLDHVAEVAHAVRRDRAFERRVPSAGIAEIDRFGQDFNALLAELQGWHDGLTSENAELARRAAHDPLTGLGNRWLFEQRLRLAIGDCAPGGQTFAVVYFDIDNFKQINDQHGHESGDAALIAVGEKLRGAIRHSDQAFRLGGDEFAALLMPLQDRTQVDRAVEQITQAMALSIRLPSAARISLPISIGVAIFPDDGQAPQDLLRHADEAMYKQKKRSQPIAGSGGNSGQDM